MAYDDLNNLNHDPALANALGNMVVAWARAETALIIAFGHIAKIRLDMATLGYYRIPTFEARTKFLRAIIIDWKGEKYDKEAITKAIEKLNGLASARNDCDPRQLVFKH